MRHVYRIVSDGLHSSNVRVLDENGQEVKGILSAEISILPNDLVRAKITVLATLGLDVVAGS
jgi:translation initiation factor IF-1